MFVIGSNSKKAASIVLLSEEKEGDSNFIKKWWSRLSRVRGAVQQVVGGQFKIVVILGQRFCCLLGGKAHAQKLVHGCRIHLW